MRLLFLGGTVFVGRHLVDAARDAGHELTLVHRGVHAAHRSDVERITDDRDGDLASLRGRHWDAAIDIAAYLPRTVTTSTNLLRDAVEQYVFISTRSAYADLENGATESSPLVALDDATTAHFEAMSTDQAKAAPGFHDAYGGLKARCELIVQRVFSRRALIVRPGLIVGPHDPTDRFTYWPSRVARGGEVLAPDRPDVITRFLDARDLATWIIRAVETRTSGVFDALGERGVTMGTVLATCRAAAAANASFTWVDEQFLLEKKVAPWTELPLWIPRAWSAALHASDARAQATGLRFRPLAETVSDVLGWDRTRLPAPRINGLVPLRESELLNAYRERHRAD